MKRKELINSPEYKEENAYIDAWRDGYKEAVDKARQWLLEQMFELNEGGEIYVADGDASTKKEFLDNFMKFMEEQQ